MLERVAGFTTRFVEVVMEPKVARMLAAPELRPVARPCVPAVLLMDATLAGAALQTTEAVKFCMTESEYVPSAVNCTLLPIATEGLAGKMASDRRTWVTVRSVDPLTEPSAAPMLVVPTLNAFTRPGTL